MNLLSAFLYIYIHFVSKFINERWQYIKGTREKYADISTIHMYINMYIYSYVYTYVYIRI